MLMSWLQNELERRWGTQEYNDAFRARVAAGDPLVRADHDLKHLLKSLGRLAGLLEECDHRNDPAGFANRESARTEIENKWADTVIVLLGLANHWPGGAIDAAKVIAKRVADKFPGEPLPDPVAQAVLSERTACAALVQAHADKMQAQADRCQTKSIKEMSLSASGELEYAADLIRKRGD